MSLFSQLQSLADRISQSRDAVTTEEATKTAFVLPFIQALGYDVFNPLEVTPELNADVGLKKGEKVDYAILVEQKPVIIFECKPMAATLNTEHSSQLFRYFSVTDVRIAVLTNGVEYHFFTDLEKPNQMDSSPFLKVNMLELDELAVPQLEKLAKKSLDIGGLLDDASQLKLLREVRQFILAESRNPSDAFIKLVANGVGISRLTPAIKASLEQVVPRAWSENIREEIKSRINSAFQQPASNETAQPEDSKTELSGDIETTDEEIQAFLILRAIGSSLADPERIVMRDAKSYCAILFDDNNRKQICRLRFSSSGKKQVTFFDESKQETTVPLTSINELYKHAEVIRSTVERFL